MELIIIIIIIIMIMVHISLVKYPKKLQVI